MALHGLAVVGLLAFAAPAQEDGKKTTAAEVAVIKISGELSESPLPSGLFGQGMENLRSTLARIGKAAKDDKVKALYLELDAGFGRGQSNEIRRAIFDFKKSGKKVYAHLTEGGAGSYIVATAADEIIMPPAAMLMLTGVRMEMTFYKDLFDKLGVKFETLQMGDFKGAGEPYSRSQMSEPLKKQMTMILDDLYEQMAAEIAAGRKKTADEIKKIVDDGPFTATAALKAGLIDRLEYPVDFKARVAQELGVKDVTLKLNYGKKKVDADFEGMGGIIKLFNELAGKESTRKNTKPRVALLHAVGMIMTGRSSGGSLFGGDVMGSETMVEAIQKIGKDPAIKAIVMRVDSPGGSALASDLIWQALKATGKPLVVSMGDVAGSGGYYIAMGADKIYAEPATITGSIGVISMKPAIEGLYQKIGLNTEVLSRGKNTGIFSDRPWTESERAAMLRISEDIYGQFTSKAAAGRKMQLDKLMSLAGGRIWTGKQAKENGLIDEVGTLEDAIAEARKLGKLDAKDTEIESFPKSKNPFEAMFGVGGDEPADAKIVQLFARHLPASLRHLVTLPTLAAKDHVLLLPSMMIEIK